MTPNALRAALAGWLGLAFAGCASPPVARYVYQDNEFGVVAIPVNTFLSRLDYRGQAEELMARHFPEGFEIVRAEEADEGQRTLDFGRKTDIQTPTFARLNQMVKFGSLERASSFEEKDLIHVREARIIYKRKAPGTPGLVGQFAPLPTLAPTLYLDPNETIRRHEKAELLAKASAADKNSNDPKLQKASTQSAK